MNAKRVSMFLVLTGVMLLPVMIFLAGCESPQPAQPSVRVKVKPQLEILVFGIEGCRKCIIEWPRVKALAARHPTVVTKLNMRHYPRLVDTWNVTSAPTYVLLTNPYLKTQSIDELEEMVDRYFRISYTEGGGETNDDRDSSSDVGGVSPGHGGDLEVLRTKEWERDYPSGE